MDPTPAPAPAGARPSATRTWVAIGLVLLALVLVYLLVNWRHGDGGIGGAGGRHAVSHRATVGLGGHDAAVLQVDSGADRITVTTANLGGDLAEVTTPNGAATHPRLQLDGSRLRVWTEDDPGGGGAAQPAGSATIDIRIARTVTWDLDVTKGAKQIVLQLGGGTVRSVALAGGADHVDLTLPRPHGTGTVRVTAGLGGTSIHLPNGVPVQVTLGAGAGSVVLDGTTRQGIAAGTTLSSSTSTTGKTTDTGKPAAGGDKDQFVVTFSGGIGDLVLDRTS